MNIILGRAFLAAALFVLTGWLFSPPCQAQIVADIDGDGTIDTGIAVSMSIPAGVPVKYYEVDVHEADTAAGTFASWRRFTIPAESTGTTAFNFKAKSSKWYKVRYRGISFSGVKPAFGSLSSAIQPLGKTALPATPSGLTALAKPKVVRLDWTASTEPDFKWARIYRNTTNTPGTALPIGRTKADWHSDESELTAGATYYYWVTFVDTSGNESAKSAVASAAYKVVTDGDTDQTVPATPGVPTLTTFTADTDGDGTLETGLTIAFTAASGTPRAIKKYRVDIYRATAVGTANSLTGYTLFDSFFTKQLSIQKKLNVKYFYKAVITGLTANDVESVASASTPTGVQPLAMAAPPAPTTVFTEVSFNFISFDISTPGTNKDILYTEVWMSPVNDMSTATLFARIEGYAAIPVFAGQQHYFWFRNINRSGVASTYYPSNPFAGVGISSPFIATTYIAQDAVNANFYANDNVAQAVAAATKTLIEEVAITYPANSAQIEVFGNFRKVTAGAHAIDISIENATGTAFKTLQNVGISAADGYGYIQATIDAPAGTSATIRMYVLCASAISISNTKLDVNVRKR